MRAHETEIATAGAGIVAIGTGDQRYAAAFVRDERIPYVVLVDDDGAAARAAQVRSPSFLSTLHPRTWKATRGTLKRGHKIHRPGARVTQMGATFVIGPGDEVHYAHIDHDSTDHAPLEDVLQALHARR